MKTLKGIGAGIIEAEASSGGGNKEPFRAPEAPARSATMTMVATITAVNAHSGMPPWTSLLHTAGCSPTAHRPGGVTVGRLSM